MDGGFLGPVQGSKTVKCIMRLLGINICNVPMDGFHCTSHSLKNYTNGRMLNCVRFHVQSVSKVNLTTFIYRTVS